MNQKKQQLQHNELADWLELKLQELKPYSNLILGGVILVIALIAGGIYWVNSQNQKAADALKGLYNATDEARFNNRIDPLVDNAERSPSSPVGLWSLQLAADTHLKAGLTTLFQSRKDGMDDIDKALEYYDQVAAKAKKGTMLYEHAMFGRAIATEAKGDVSGAIEAYQVLIDEGTQDDGGEPTSPVGKLAKKYQDRLKSFAGADQFQEAFVNYTPPIIPPTTPGAGGLTPGGLSTDGLRTMPDISFPADLDLGSGPDLGTGLESGSGTGAEAGGGEGGEAQPALGGGALKPPANAGGDGESEGGTEDGSESSESSGEADGGTGESGGESEEGQSSDDGSESDGGSKP